MPNYSRLKNLNAEYEAKLEELTEPKKPFRTTLIGIILIAIIVISVVRALIVPDAEWVAWEIAVCIVVPIFSVLLMVIQWRKYKKRSDAYNDSIDHMQQILKKAIELRKESD